MGFKKYQKVEQSDVLSPQEHDQIQENLKKVGKTSARDLDEQERQQVLGALDENR